jgi:glutathione synthase
VPRPYLFVMDPLERVNPNADTTFDFMLEAQRRGIEPWMCTIGDLFTEGARGFARCAPVAARRPTDDDPSFCALGDFVERPFDDFATLWMRKDPPVDEAFILSTMLLDRHDPTKTLALNTPSSLRVANEKLWSLFAAELGPETVVSARADVLVRAVERWGRGVLKPVSLAGGAGVMAFDAGDRNLKAAADLLTAEGKRPAIVQAYLEQVRDGDKRVILLGGKAIGAVLRVPQPDDNRANMHVGGGVAKAEVTERDHEIASVIGPHLVKLGIHFAGIDVIGDKLTEVNVTSPTGVQEIDRLDGREGDERMSTQVMTYVAALLDQAGIPT